MEKRNNKVDFSSYFENDLFDKSDIDLIDEKVETNLAILLDTKDYVEINKKFRDITLKLTSSLNSQQKEFLNEYQRIELEITSYQNCLAYYLGIQAMANVDKLK